MATNKNNKLKPLIGLIGVSLAGVTLLFLIILLFTFFWVEMDYWIGTKHAQQQIKQSLVTATEAKIIGSAIHQHPGYITYLKNKK